MVLDTETTGIPIMKDFNVFHEPSSLEYYKESRLIEIGYIIYSHEGTKLSDYECIIKPNDFIIKNHHIHGITNDIAKKEGKNINDALDNLNKSLDTIDLIVGHNIMFDISIILSECYRNNRKDLIEKLKIKFTICTMKMAKNIFGTIYNLQTLYRMLHNKYTDQKHRALDDAHICADCYFFMLKNSIV